MEQYNERRDPDLVANRFVDIVTEGRVEAVNGGYIDVPADSICIHGDNPNAVEVLEAIHERLDEENIELTSLDEPA